MEDYFTQRKMRQFVKSALKNSEIFLSSLVTLFLLSLSYQNVKDNNITMLPISTPSHKKISIIEALLFKKISRLGGFLVCNNNKRLMRNINILIIVY